MCLKEHILYHYTHSKDPQRTNLIKVQVALKIDTIEISREVSTRSMIS